MNGQPIQGSAFLGQYFDVVKKEFWSRLYRIATYGRAEPALALDRPVREAAVADADTRFDDGLSRRTWED